MEWTSFWSAVIGGVLVIAGHLVVHWLNRSAKAADAKNTAEERIAGLALEIVNWFETDTHRVFNAMGGPMPTVEQGHPVYSLAAAVRKNRPDLKDTVGGILVLFREYYQASRMLLPRAKTKQESDDCVDKVTTNANEIMKQLNTIVDAVCD